MDVRDFCVRGIEGISNGLIIKITPLKPNELLPPPNRFTGIQSSFFPSSNVGSHMPQVILSMEKERTDFFGCNGHLPIQIPGEIQKRAANIVFVNGVKVSLGDVPFALFLRLVVELVKNKKSTMSRSKLVNTGFIKAGSEFQSVSRLREPFKVALGSLSLNEFIETCENKSIRLSISPSFISYDKERLLNHRNHKVRRLARCLP